MKSMKPSQIGAGPGHRAGGEFFEGLHTMRIYNLLIHGKTFEKIRCIPTCCRSSKES